MERELKRIAVLGSPGSGKTFLAARLGNILDLPVIHLDDLFWETWRVGPDPSPHEIRAKLEEVAQRSQWIIDGNHGGQKRVDARRTRLEAADAIFYLDMPPLVCVLRLIQRRLTLFGMKNEPLRPNQWLTWHIIKSAWTFRRRDLAREALAYSTSKPVVVLRSPRSVARLIRDCAKQGETAVITFVQVPDE